jgi:hypothetical protein
MDLQPTASFWVEKALWSQREDAEGVSISWRVNDDNGHSLAQYQTNIPNDWQGGTDVIERSDEPVRIPVVTQGIRLSDGLVENALHIGEEDGQPLARGIIVVSFELTHHHGTIKPKSKRAAISETPGQTKWLN